MNSLRSSAFAAVLCTLAVLGGFFVSTFVLERYRIASARADVNASRQALAGASDLATVFRHVGRVVEPSVVALVVERSGVSGFDEETLRDLLPGRPGTPRDFEDGRDPSRFAGGSGVIVDADGTSAWIVTNNHVVAGATRIVVTLADGREITDVRLVGTDARSDIAVIQATVGNVIPAKWGSSDDIQKGDWVLAFGAPFGLAGSMTHGIVSALNRQAGVLGNLGYENFIQTDAPINPGNSGGPLVNLRGEVIGINTAILTRNGSFQGIGLAVPANQASAVYQSLRTRGRVLRGWLGIEIGDAASHRDELAALGAPDRRGVLIRGILTASPADGKLRPGDVVTHANATPTDTVQRLRNVIANVAPGQSVTLTVLRAGKDAKVQIPVGLQPSAATPTFGDPLLPSVAGRTDVRTLVDLGMQLATLTDADRGRLGVPDASGVWIVALSNRFPFLIPPTSPRESPAPVLVPGLVITSINGTAITSADQAADLLSRADFTVGVSVTTVRKEAQRYYLLKSPPKR